MIYSILLILLIPMFFLFFSFLDSRGWWIKLTENDDDDEAT